MQKPPVDLPKFKRVHKSLWDQMLQQKRIIAWVNKATTGRTTAHERECLERVGTECQAALRHMNAAIQRLFETVV